MTRLPFHPYTATIAVAIGCCTVQGGEVGVRHTGPGVDFDLQGFIDRAIKDGAKRIVISPGRYRVRPKRREHLRGKAKLEQCDTLVAE